MIVSSLVVTLDPDPELRATALASLRADPSLTLGEPIGDRLPVVAESESSGHGAREVEALGGTPGVIRVDVVAIDFSLEQP